MTRFTARRGRRREVGEWAGFGKEGSGGQPPSCGKICRAEAWQFNSLHRRAFQFNEASDAWKFHDRGDVGGLET